MKAFRQKLLKLKKDEPIDVVVVSNSGHSTVGKIYKTSEEYDYFMFVSNNPDYRGGNPIINSCSDYKYGWTINCYDNHWQYENKFSVIKPFKQSTKDYNLKCFNYDKDKKYSNR